LSVHQLAALRTEARLSESADAAPLPDPGDLSRLSGHDVAMGSILAAMIAFGVGVGVVFPLLVTPLMNLRPGGEGVFRIACIAAGFCVGAFAYGVARFTLFRANQRLARIAAYDGLTGVFNQRQFARSLSVELVRAERMGQPASLIITDLDRFKSVNDTYGHIVGDDVLAAVAHDVVSCVRPFDVPCRIGGEEFAVILPQTGKDETVAVAARIRSQVALTDHEGLPEVTISCGVATYPDDADAIGLLTKRADDAMYAAKRAGRNAVRAWPVGGA